MNVKLLTSDFDLKIPAAIAPGFHFLPLRAGNELASDQFSVFVLQGLLHKARPNTAVITDAITVKTGDVSVFNRKFGNYIDDSSKPHGRKTR